MFNLTKLFFNDSPTYNQESHLQSLQTRKSVCLRPHCSSKCTKISEEYKFWADLLGGLPINNKKFAYYLEKMDPNYRAEVYRRFVGCSITTLKTTKTEIDGLIVLKILELCCDEKENMESRIFYIFKSLESYTNPKIQDHIIRMIKNLMYVPGIDDELIFRVLYTFLHEMEFRNCDEKKLEFLLTEQLFLRFLDIVVCLNLPHAHFVKIGGSMKISEPFNYKKFAEAGFGRSCERNKTELKVENEYFDSLVIQNEMQKNFEDKKNALNEKISLLEQENERLKNKNDNLKENCIAMEYLLKDLEDNNRKEWANIISGLKKELYTLKNKK